VKKWILAILLMGIVCVVGSDKGRAQNDEFQTITLSGTADIIIDSTLQFTPYMKGKRLYLNGIYYWWDNAANTNPFYIEVVRGQTAMVVAGSQRQFRFSEAMTSSGVKGAAITPNLTTGPDSTIYFVVSATGSDSLFVQFNYKFVGK
jgi:hypothetical protein